MYPALTFTLLRTRELDLLVSAHPAKAQCSDLASRLDGKEAELTKAKDTSMAIQAQLEQVGIHCSSLLTPLEMAKLIAPST